MWLFAILLTIMTKNSIFDVSRDSKFTFVFVLLILISLWFWEITGNIEKPEQSHWKGPEKRLTARKLCRKTGTVLVLKLYIDFITLGDDLMEDGIVTIKNVFELFKQIV